MSALCFPVRAWAALPLLLATAWSLPAAETPAGGPTAQPRFILTSSDEILAGQLEDFADGLLLLRSGSKMIEISPGQIRGIFMLKSDAERAKLEPGWLGEQAPAPPDEAKPDAPPGKPEQEASRHGPAAEETPDIEREYFAQQPPADPPQQDRFFEECLHQAVRIAKHYRQLGREQLQERRKTVGAMAVNSIQEPRTMLEPKSYRPVLLTLALSREELHFLREGLETAAPGERRKALESEMERRKKALGLYVTLYGKTVFSSALSEAEKETVRKRLRGMHEVLAPAAFGPGKRLGKPDDARRWGKHEARPRPFRREGEEPAE